MARLRETERLEPQQPTPGVDERRLFYRRMRRCVECPAESTWTLEDVGPLCGLHLAAFGVEVPAVRPANDCAVVKVVR